MKPLPWKLYSRRELDEIATSLGARAQAWGKAWLPDVAIGLEVAASLKDGVHGGASASAAPAPPLLALNDEKTSSTSAVFHAKAMPSALQAAAAAALGAPAAGAGNATLRDLMTVHALRDLLVRLAGLPAGSERKHALFRERPGVTPHAARGCPALWLTLRIGQEECAVWLAHAPGTPRAPARADAARRTLSPRLEALHSRRIRLRVVAGEASLPLSELMRLGCGDVVLLDRRADAPMTLENAAGAKLGRGYLGLQDEKPVLQIEAGV